MILPPLFINYTTTQNKKTENYQDDDKVNFNDRLIKCGNLPKNINESTFKKILQSLNGKNGEIKKIIKPIINDEEHGKTNIYPWKIICDKKFARFLLKKKKITIFQNIENEKETTKVGFLNDEIDNRKNRNKGEYDISKENIKERNSNEIDKKERSLISENAKKEKYNKVGKKISKIHNEFHIHKNKKDTNETLENVFKNVTVSNKNFQDETKSVKCINQQDGEHGEEIKNKRQKKNIHYKSDESQISESSKTEENTDEDKYDDIESDDSEKFYERSNLFNLYTNDKENDSMNTELKNRTCNSKPIKDKPKVNERTHIYIDNFYIKKEIVHSDIPKTNQIFWPHNSDLQKSDITDSSEEEQTKKNEEATKDMRKENKEHDLTNEEKTLGTKEFSNNIINTYYNNMEVKIVNENVHSKNEETDKKCIYLTDDNNVLKQIKKENVEKIKKEEKMQLTDDESSVENIPIGNLKIRKWKKIKKSNVEKFVIYFYKGRIEENIKNVRKEDRIKLEEILSMKYTESDRSETNERKKNDKDILKKANNTIEEEPAEKVFTEGDNLREKDKRKECEKERERERERERGREKEKEKEKEKKRGQEREKERERAKERELEQGRAKEKEKGRENNREMEKIKGKEKERGREKERERDGERQREREIDRERDGERQREKNRDREREREREGERYLEKEREGERYLEKEREGDKYLEREREGERYIERDREGERYRAREREREREIGRYRKREKERETERYREREKERETERYREREREKERETERYRGRERERKRERERERERGREYHRRGYD